MRIAIAAAKRPMNVESVRIELESLDGYLAECFIDGIPQNSLDGGVVWSFAHPDLLALYRRLRESSASLGGLLGSVASTYGIKTGLNEAYVLSGTERDALVTSQRGADAIIRRWARGQDIRRWRPSKSDLWLLLLKSSSDADCETPWRTEQDQARAEAIFAQEYPTVYQRMSSYKEYRNQKNGKILGLIHRSDKGRFWWELRSCSYYAEFKKEKMVWKDISYTPTFAWDPEETYYGNTAFFSSSAPKWMVALCNSMPFSWLASMSLFEAKDAYYRWLPSDLADIPVPDATEETIKRLEALVDAASIDETLKEAEGEIDDICFGLYGISGGLRSMIESWHALRLRAETISSMSEYDAE